MNQTSNLGDNLAAIQTAWIEIRLQVERLTNHIPTHEALDAATTLELHSIVTRFRSALDSTDRAAFSIFRFLDTRPPPQWPPSRVETRTSTAARTAARSVPTVDDLL